MLNKETLDPLNEFLKNNIVYVPSDDEGNSYQQTSKVSLIKAYVHKHDNQYKPDDLYFPDDMEDYKDEMEDFKEVFVLNY